MKPDPGSTGNYPEGKINDDDEGEIQFIIGTEGGNVILDFGTPVAWLGIPPDQAIDLAQALIQRAVDLGHTRVIAIRVGS